MHAEAPRGRPAHQVVVGLEARDRRPGRWRRTPAASSRAGSGATSFHLTSIRSVSAPSALISFSVASRTSGPERTRYGWSSNIDHCDCERRRGARERERDRERGRQRQERRVRQACDDLRSGLWHLIHPLLGVVRRGCAAQCLNASAGARLRCSTGAHRSLRSGGAVLPRVAPPPYGKAASRSRRRASGRRRRPPAPSGCRADWGCGFPPSYPGFTRKSRRIQTSAPFRYGFCAKTPRW